MFIYTGICFWTNFREETNATGFYYQVYFIYNNLFATDLRPKMK